MNRAELLQAPTRRLAPDSLQRVSVIVSFLDLHDRFMRLRNDPLAPDDAVVPLRALEAQAAKLCLVCVDEGRLDFDRKLFEPDLSNVSISNRDKLWEMSWWIIRMLVASKAPHLLPSPFAIGAYKWEALRDRDQKRVDWASIGGQPRTLWRSRAEDNAAACKVLAEMTSETPIARLPIVYGPPSETWLWDARPLEKESWGNIVGFDDGSGSAGYIEMRRWKKLSRNGLVNQLAVYRPAHAPIPPIVYQDDGTRNCYIPTADDLESIRLAYQSHSNPSDPPWSRIEADLIAAGRTRDEAIGMNPPTILRLIRGVKSERPPLRSSTEQNDIAILLAKLCETADAEGRVLWHVRQIDTSPHESASMIGRMKYNPRQSFIMLHAPALGWDAEYSERLMQLALSKEYIEHRPADAFTERVSIDDRTYLTHHSRHIRLTEKGKHEARRSLPAQSTCAAEEDAPELNDTERFILEALGTARMTGEDIACKLRYSFNSNFKSTLSSMRKRGILVNLNDSRGRGYEVARQLSGQ